MKKEQFYLCGELFKRISHISGLFVVFCILLAFSKSIISLVLLIFPTIIIDKISEGELLNSIIPAVILCIAIPTVLSILNAMLDKQISCMAKKTENELEKSVNQVLISVRYDKLENPEIFNKLQILQEAKNMVGPLTGIIQNQITSIIACGFRIAFCIPFLLQLVRTDYLPMTLSHYTEIPNYVRKIASTSGIYLIMVMMLSMVSIKIKSHLEFRRNKILEQYVNVERAYGYYTSLVADYENGADIRLNGLSSFIEKKRIDYKQNEKKMYFALGEEECTWGIVLTFISRVEIIVSYMIIISKILCGTISIGGIYLYVNMISQFVENMNECFQQVGEVRAALEYYKVYPSLWVLGAMENKNDNEQSVSQKYSDTVIQFCEVSFHYPGSNQWIIHNMNLSIKKNEKIAIVGPNGAGKSTLVKLIMGLYEPQEGQIYILGRDIRSYSKRELYALYSVVFQDNHFWASSISNNIASSEVYDDEKIEEIIEIVGLKDRIGEKENTMQFSRHLSQEGIIFSGGEEQKLAIARMLYKNAPIYIMDEPTASLDPISEKEISEKMNEVAKNHTSIMISHRLSNCCISDRIIVLRKGKIVEEGKHAQLLKEDGLYSLMWKLQSGYYK